MIRRARAALAFLAAGGSKLARVERMVTRFAEMGIGQSFRNLMGALGLLRAGLIAFPATAAAGGALLACVMVGAIAAHLAVIGGSAVPAGILPAVTAAVAWRRRPRQ